MAILGQTVLLMLAQRLQLANTLLVLVFMVLEILLFFLLILDGAELIWFNRLPVGIKIGFLTLISGFEGVTQFIAPLPLLDLASLAFGLLLSFLGLLIVTASHLFNSLSFSVGKKLMAVASLSFVRH